MDGEESLMAGNGDVVGYTFDSENLCPGCTIVAMGAAGIKVQRGTRHEDAIKRAAENLGIDYSDQRSYDSGDFPKPVIGQGCQTELIELPDGISNKGSRMLEDERCTGCGKWLRLEEKSPGESAFVKQVMHHFDLSRPLAKIAVAELCQHGLTHLEFIAEEDVKWAISQHPHDFEVFHYPKGVATRYTTPQGAYDECYSCGQFWEDHTFRCDVCGENVQALTIHRHAVVPRGQRSLFRINRKENAK